MLRFQRIYSFVENTQTPMEYALLTSDIDLKSMQKILDLLDEDDDVQEVWHNWEE